MSLKINDLKNLQSFNGHDADFLRFLQGEDQVLYERLLEARWASQSCLNSKEIMDIALFVEAYISSQFSIKFVPQAPFTHLAAFKKIFVQKYATKRYGRDAAVNFDGKELERQLRERMSDSWSHEALATQVLSWLEEEDQYKDSLDLAARYVAWRVWAFEPHQHEQTPWFSLQQPLNFSELIPAHLPSRGRDGFNLTDPGPGETYAHDQSHICLSCHRTQKDSCRTGLRDEGKKPKVNALDNQLTGCPLQQKISEMITLYRAGHTLAAFAVAMLDNPFLALTGHRICNDCAKSCIFQKQTPVDIPAVESEILKAVLALPWGLEIYQLLAWWNPLNTQAPLPKLPSGKKVMVVGQGPAGIAMSYYLLREGHTVVAIDGLKIEPLPDTWLQPQHNFTDVTCPLEQRPGRGFGGVAEYGITARWDKNRLMVWRIILARQERYTLHDGVRLGSQITLENAFANGIDHMALATGAGAPMMLDVPGLEAKGVRFAADFLMNLHLNAAFDLKKLMALQLRLPIVVVGGGLTAVDTATEAQAYYVRLVERAADLAQHANACTLTAVEKELLAEYLSHAREIAAERAVASQENRDPRFAPLVQRWGGCTVVYRKALQHAPSYRLNHEELKHALAEGVQFLSNFQLQRILQDDEGHVRALQGLHHGEIAEIPAATVLIAIGTRQDQSNLTDPRITFLGDANPAFAGSVVKAIASAKALYPTIHAALQCTAHASEKFHALENDLKAHVVSVKPLAEGVIEVVVHAPAAARQWRPGQFFKMQNYEAFAPQVGAYKALMEPIALTACWVDSAQGHIGLVALEVGVSTYLLRYLQPGERIVLMGPTGAPTPLLHNKTVALVGGGLGTAVLLPLAKTLKQQGCRVLLAVGYQNPQKVFYQEKLSAISDHLLLSYEVPTAEAYQGRITQALEAFVQTAEGKHWIAAVDYWMICGSSPMMAACRDLLYEGALAPLIKHQVHAEASLNNPMQCMMHGICGSCIQRLQCEDTGRDIYRFICAGQDQPLQQVDFTFLEAQLSQNSLMEKLSYAALKISEECSSKERETR